ncbi:MAG: imidazole glycerol phosphate synthase subunit HisF [Clostridia bacterium]|jgi:cyclase|nr:imidazole glycerol phosphate synthase subunit HisF [Clostridia bacterium]
MLAKRIIPCLDVKDGRVVKGKNFQNISDVDDPVALAKYYSENGADELVFYDITASREQRALFCEILKNLAQNVFIPLTVGGGINSLSDFDRVLKCGADKVSVNSGAIASPSLIREASELYGSQCVVLSIDVKRVNGIFTVFSHGGSVDTGMDAVAWAKFGAENGAGEIVLNSIDTDGVRSGFDLELLNAVTGAVNVPVVASGGAGAIEDFIRLFTLTDADAGLGASVFHFNQFGIAQLKRALKDHGIEVRI